MKKKIITLLLSMFLFVTGTFALSACSEPEVEPEAKVVGITVELINTDYEMIDNKISLVYGSKVNLSYTDFKVTAIMDNDKTKELSRKSASFDGYIYQSSIPQSYDKTPVNNYRIVFNYKDLDPVSIDVEVTKGTMDFSPIWNYLESYEYTGDAQTVEVINVPEGVNVEYTGTTSATDVGEYTCTASFTCEDYYNYNEIPDVSLVWYVKPRVIEVEGLTTVDKIYNEIEQEVEIDLNSLPSNMIIESIEGDIVGRNVGQYNIVINLALLSDDADNYIVMPYETTWTILPAVYSGLGSVLFLNGSEYVYTGREISVELDYSSLDSNMRVVGTPIGLTATNVGEYEIVITIEYDGSDSNYQIVTRTITLDWKIVKAPLIITPRDHTITYGDQLSYNGIDTPIGFVDGEDLSVLDGELEYNCDYQQYDDCGEYDITISGYSSRNYDISYNSSKLIVEKKVLQIEPKNVSIEYGSELTFVEINDPIGFVYNDSLLVLEGELEYNCDYKKGSNVGEYTISISGYESDNYEIIYGTSILTVTKSTISVEGVSLVADEFTYDSTVHTIEVDDSTLPIGVYVSRIIVDRSGRETKNAGEYTAIVSLKYVDEINYETIPDLYFVWKINKANVDIGDYSIVNNTFTYNGQKQSPTFTSLPVGARIVSMTGASGKDVNLYQCSVTIACSDKVNYNDFTEVKVFNWNIVPKSLIVTANNSQVEYGMPGENAGVVYSGFVPGEDQRNLSGSIVYSYVNYSAGSNKGTYTIKISGYESNNYDIEYRNGQLEVYAKVVDLSKYFAEWQSQIIKEYDPYNAFMPVIINLPEGVEARYSYYLNGSFGYAIDKPLEVGQYLATATLYAINNNYSVINNNGVEGFAFEIIKGNIDASLLTWSVSDNAEIDWSGNNLKPTYTNNVVGLTVQYTYHKWDLNQYIKLDDTTEIIDVGKYKAVASFGYDQNCYDSFVEPQSTEVIFSIVKIGVSPTSLVWNIPSIMNSQEDNAKYYIADYTYNGIEKSVGLSDNTYLTVEYFVNNEYVSSCPTILVTGDYEFVARVRVKDNYVNTHKLSTNEEYFYYYIDICVSRTIFTLLKIGDVQYEIEEMPSDIYVMYGSSIEYSIKSTYSLMYWNDQWEEVNSGYVFDKYNQKQTLYVVDRAINPTLDPSNRESILYEINIYTYIVKNVTFGVDNVKIDYPNGNNYTYELQDKEEQLTITYDNDAQLLLDSFDFKYMIINTNGDWLDPIDINSMPLVFDDLEGIHTIILLVSCDDMPSNIVTQITIVPQTYISCYNVSYMHFYANEEQSDNCDKGSNSYSICNGIITGFEVVLEDDYINYSISYYADENYTKQFDNSNISNCLIVYYVIRDIDDEVVESGEFTFYHSFVPSNYPIRMNSVDPNADNNDYVVTVNVPTFIVKYHIAQNNGLEITQTYNGLSNIILQAGEQKVDYLLTITFDGKIYKFEMPLTVICN